MRTGNFRGGGGWTRENRWLVVEKVEGGKRENRYDVVKVIKNF